MAQRRMFSPDIVNSDAFLDMPASSQLLYFHLAMRADDDGFVTPKMVMRIIGSGDDDMKVLMLKRFILPFESGVIVIKHWLIHNLIRADLYKETLYKKEKSMLGLNENGAYTELREGVSEIKKIEAPEWLKKRKGLQRTANVPLSALRIGKDRIGKDSTEHTDDPSDQEKGFEYNPLFVEFWTAYPKKTGKGFAHTAWNKIKPKVSRETADKIIASVKAHSQTDQWKKENGQYIPNPATFINQRRWEDEVSNHGPQSANHDPKYGNLDIKEA